MKYSTNFINDELLERIIRNTIRCAIPPAHPAYLKVLDNRALRNAKRTINRYEKKLIGHTYDTDL